MNTLLEFITHTKGVEYLIAIAFLFLFLAFWYIMQHKGKGLIIRIVPVLVISLGLGAMALTYAVQETTAEVTSPTPEIIMLSSSVLVEMYGPSSFNHELHQILVEDCKTCHHYSTELAPPCKDCHSTPFDPDNLNKPGIAHVYHLRCISCHIEEQAGPVECIECHNSATVSPLPITHPLTGNGNCISCHDAEIPGVPGLPSDHESATNSVCQLCHQTVVEETKMAIGKIPHEITGFEYCLMCHGEGIGDVNIVPPDHVGRTNETCNVCHKPQE